MHPNELYKRHPRTPDPCAGLSIVGITIMTANATVTPTRSHHKKSRVPTWVLVALLSGFVIVLALMLRSRPPTLLVQASAAPVDLVHSGNRWFWVEVPNGPRARLMYAESGMPHEVDTADAMPVVTAGDGDLAWSKRSGVGWHISLILSGGARRDISRALRRPMGLYIGGGNLWWCEAAPPLSKTDSVDLPFPPFQRATAIFCYNILTQAVRQVSILMEPQAEPLGVSGSFLYAAAQRATLPGCTVIYTIDTSSGSSARVASEEGIHPAILGSDSRPVWMGTSREATFDAGVETMSSVSALGAPHIVADWMPSGGRLYRTADGVVYVDGNAAPHAWRALGDAHLFPQLIPTPEGFFPIAAGDTTLLLTRAGSTSNRLYSVSLP